MLYRSRLSRCRLHLPFLGAAVLGLILYLNLTAAPATATTNSTIPALPQLATTQAITATKTDHLLIDKNGDGRAGSGDTLEYTVVLTNDSATAATNIFFSDTIDLNTTLSNTLHSTPLALPDSYEVISNTRLVISATNGVLQGNASLYGADSDRDGGVVTATAVVSATTTQSGTISLATDGSFIYEPPLGFTGTDTYTYTIIDDEGEINRDTITFVISDVVGDINNTAARIIIVWDNNDSFVLPLKNSRTAKAAVFPATLPPLSGETVNLTINTLPPSKTITLTFQVAIDSPLLVGVSGVCNQATLTADGPITIVTDDPETTAASDATCTTLQTSADLAISKTASTNPVLSGALLTYTITATNNGPDGVAGIVVTDTLPAAFTPSSTNCGAAGTPLVWAVGNLGSGASQSCLISGTVASAFSGLLTNTAVITASAVTDALQTNNTVTETTLVQAPPHLAIDDVTVDEGAGSATFTLALSATIGLDVTAIVSTTNGTAVAPADYTTISTTATIASGHLTTTVAISITDDTLFETSETFSVTLSNASNAVISDSLGIGTITDNDSTPTVNLADVTVSEAAAQAIITGTLSNPSTASVTVTVATAAGTATAAADYVSTTVTTTVPPLTTLFTVTVPLSDDLIVELDETFTVSTTAITGGSAGTAATVTIIDDDSATVDFSTAAYTVAEEGGLAVITVTLDQPAPFPVTVNYATSNNSATAGADYTAASGTVIFTAGMTTTTFVVNILNDNTYEGPETLNLTLSNNTPAAKTVLGSAHNPALLTIVSDEALPAVHFQRNYIINESAGGFMATLVLSHPSAYPVMVHIASSNNTAVAEQDYTAVNRNVTIPALETTAEVPITIIDDALYESIESFLLTLSKPVSATLGLPNPINVDIVEDGVPPTISIADRAAVETDGPTTMSFKVTLTGRSSLPITVHYASADLNASSDPGAFGGADYTAVNGTLTFPPRTGSQTINVTILGDTTAENDEDFTITLSTPTNATLADATAVGSILNDDGALLYFPIIHRELPATGPDLIVRTILASPGDVQLLIQNIGDAAVVENFWVDVYINPTKPPTGPNQTIQTLRSQGFVWSVVGQTIAPGDVLALTIGGSFYRPDLSSDPFPLAVGTPIYAQVDSANAGVSYGAVLENHEILNGVYNNILRTVVEN